MLTKAIYSKRFCRIMQDSAWFCKIMLNSETFCMFYEKFEAYLPKILLRNYQRLKQTLPIWRYGVQKLNYQRSKLPILKVTNIEVYLYMVCPKSLYSSSNRRGLVGSWIKMFRLFFSQDMSQFLLWIFHVCTLSFTKINKNETYTLE